MPTIASDPGLALRCDRAILAGLLAAAIGRDELIDEQGAAVLADYLEECGHPIAEALRGESSFPFLQDFPSYLYLIASRRAILYARNHGIRTYARRSRMEMGRLWLQRWLEENSPLA